MSRKEEEQKLYDAKQAAYSELIKAGPSVGYHTEGDDQRETQDVGGVIGRSSIVEDSAGKLRTVHGRGRIVVADGETTVIPGKSEFPEVTVDGLGAITSGLMTDAKNAIRADRQRKKKRLRKKD